MNSIEDILDSLRQARSGVDGLDFKDGAGEEAIEVIDNAIELLEGAELVEPESDD